MKTSNLIQDPPGAHASGPRGGMPSPSINHHANFMLVGHGHSQPPRWRRRILAGAVAVAVLGICGLVVQADVVYEPLLKFGDPEKPFRAVAFTPDGQQVLSSVGGEPENFEGSVAVLWDLQTGQQVRVFEGGSGPVAVSPDGGWGLSASETNTAKLWNLQTGELTRTFVGHTNTITAVAFSPDGRQMLTGSTDRTVRLWGTESGELRHTLLLTNPVVSAVFSPDGRYVLTGQAGEGDDYYRAPPRLWDAQTGELVRTFEGAGAAAAFAMGGRSVSALRTGTWEFSLWDIQTSQSVSLSTDWPPNFTLSPDGGLALIHGGGKQRVAPHLLDLAGNRVVRWFDQSAGGCFEAGCAAFSPDGRRLVIGASCCTSLWDIGDLVDWLAVGRLNQLDVVSEPMGTFGYPCGDLFDAMVSADGTQFISAGARSSAGIPGVYVRDIASGDVIRGFGMGVACSPAALSPDGQRLLTGGPTGLALWDFQTGRLLTNFVAAEHACSVDFSPDGLQFVTGGDPLDPRLLLWDASTGRIVREFGGHGPGGVSAVAFSPDGLQILTGGWTTDPRLNAKLWDARSGQLLLTLVGHTNSIWSCAFSPDGSQLLTGSWDCTARLWDKQTGNQLWSFVGHRDTVDAVAFSPNGKRVLTGSWDGTAKLWETDTGRLLVTLPGHYFVFAVGFLAGGQRLWTAERFGGRVWDTASGQLLRTIDGYGPLLDTAVLISGSTSHSRQRILCFGAVGQSLRSARSDV